MGLKDRFEEEQQRRRAKAYFRKNNSEFFSASQWLMISFSTLLISLVLGVGIGLFINLIGIFFSALYLVGAYLIIKTATKVANTANSKLIIVCMLGYTVMLFMAQTVFIYGITYLRYFDFITVLRSFTMIGRSYLTLIFILLGYVYIYQSLK